MAAGDVPAGVTDSGARDVLTGGRLPVDGRVMRFGPLVRGPVRTVGRLVPGTGGRADGLGDLLVIGHLAGDDDDDAVVLDGATGAVGHVYLGLDPALCEMLPIAASLDVLARNLAALSAFERRAGAFSAFRGASGVAAVDAATRLLLDVFGDPDEDDDPAVPFWAAQAVVGPLALLAPRGTDLVLDIAPAALDAEFGADDVRRWDDADLPPQLVHAPTRRFLRDVGLPAANPMFLVGGEPPSVLAGSPGGRLIRLGDLVHDIALVVDGETGAVHGRYAAEGVLRAVNADVSTLVFAVWMHHRERESELRDHLNHDWYTVTAHAMVRVLGAVDPVACHAADEDDFRYWPEAFHDEAGGVL